MRDGPLGREIARTTEEYSNYKISPENTLVTNGGKQAIITAFMSILNNKDEVIIPKPYWTTYPEAVKIAGGNPVFVDSNLESDFKIADFIAQNRDINNSFIFAHLYLSEVLKIDHFDDKKRLELILDFMSYKGIP